MAPRPAAGSGSEGTRQVTSPGTPRPSRLVARIRRSGQQPSSLVASSADAASRCSQLSSTSSRRCGRSTRIRRCARSAPARSSTPAARATAAQTRSGSGTPLRSTRFTPSANPGAAMAAPSIASRVLPTPPAPTRVTSRSPPGARSPPSRPGHGRPGRSTAAVNRAATPGHHVPAIQFPRPDPPSIRYRDQRAPHPSPGTAPRLPLRPLSRAGHQVHLSPARYR